MFPLSLPWETSQRTGFSRNQSLNEKDIIQPVTQATGKKLQVLSTEVEPMPFRTPVGHSRPGYN